MDTFDILFKSDVARYGDAKIEKWTYKFLYYLRKASTCNTKIICYYYRLKYKKISEKHGIEIPRNTKIGKGFYLGHPYNITINEDAILGENINIHKGVTIGQENRGKRKGVPTIGNKVWIGINSTIVGAVVIGDDVLIAPNSYVNCDVPSHSVVMGNPCIIKPKDNATECYITNIE